MSRADVAVGLILVGLSAYLLFGGADFGAGLWHLLARRRARATARSRTGRADLAVVGVQQNAAGQNAAGQNIAHQNVAHQNVAHQNVAHQNVAHQNVAHQNVAGQNIAHENVAHQVAADDNVADRKAVDRNGAEQDVIEHAMGPVWEANHVWLIFVMVMTWTAFPPVFASIMTAHWVPLSLAALGIVVRGSAFVFAKALPDGRWYAWAFGVSSLLTPYCMGAVAGAIAAGGASWLSPSGVYAGLLCTGLCGYLAAVYLTADARRLAGSEATEWFRRCALTAGVAMGLLALPGGAFFDVRSPLIALSAAAGLVSLGLLVVRRYLAVRVTVALAAASVLWGAAALSSLDFDGAAAHDAVLQVVFWSLGLGAIVLVPSLTWLYVLFQRAEQGR